MNTAFFGKIAALWRGLSLWVRFGLVAFVFAAIVGTLYVVNGRGSAAVSEAPNLRAVQVASVTDLKNDTTPLPLIGEVKSVNEAKIHTQSAGTITQLYRRLGSSVGVGSIIAEIENSTQRAALLQAQGALEAAQAGVQKSGKLFEESRKSALNTVKGVYSSNDDIIRSKLDTMFSNPSGNLPRYVLNVSDQSLLNKVESTRLRLNSLLKEETNRAALVNESTDLKVEIQTAIEETRTVKAYVDDMAALLNVSISSPEHTQSDIDAFVAVVSAARTVVAASLSSLTTASQALISAQSEAEKPEEASASNAAIKQAQAGVQAAEASLEKTIIRSPIGGTVNNLSIKLGDFVSMFQQVAVVSNNGSLEIVAHITPEDRATIAAGSKVRIENAYDGAVASIAPAIDPTTKKIEVKVSFGGRAEELTNGENVHLDIARTPKKTTNTSGISLPISAVKIGTQSSVIFTVGADNKLVAHTVTTGGLVGDKIQILSGVTEDMQLVVDARGLKDGQEVELQ